MKNDFEAMGLSFDLLKSLEAMQYEQATAVQKEVIPLILSGESLLVESETGSGKTAAFGIPICEKIDWSCRLPSALIIAPTRELALQIEMELSSLGRFKGLKTLSLLGKYSLEDQKKRLRERQHILVATPGRLLDHLEKGNLNVKELQTIVLDEADELLRMGFLEQVQAIFKFMPSSSQKLLFSATFPLDFLDEMASSFSQLKFLRIESKKQVKLRVKQEYYFSFDQEKESMLESVFYDLNPDTAIVFANTKDQVDSLYHFLQKRKWQVGKLHGDMEQKSRTKVMEDFKKGGFRYLLASDIAARGIDVADVDLIVNYDVPENVSIYTHRIGRSARQDKLGHALILCHPKEEAFLQTILKRFPNDISPYQPIKKLEFEARKMDFLEKQKVFRPKKDPSLAAFAQEISRLHVNAGKKDKMRALDLVGALTSLEGIEAEDIGVIEIIEHSSFVDILNKKGPDVLKLLQDHPIKGKLRRVSLVVEE